MIGAEYYRLTNQHKEPSSDKSILASDKKVYVKKWRIKAVGFFVLFDLFSGNEVFGERYFMYGRQVMKISSVYLIINNLFLSLCNS